MLVGHMSLPRFVVRGFRRPADVLSSALGTLERQVMELVWQREAETSVWDAHAALGGELAYTTLMTTLDRLHKKGLLSRRKAGRAFFYTPRLARHEFEGTMASELIGGLLNGDEGVRPILSCIVEAVGARDRAALDELERLVREKRRSLNLRGRRS